MKTIFKAIAIATLAAMISGCIRDVVVETTKPWEGHYYTQDECKDTADSITLEKNESVWILSNRTLKRLLDNTRK